MKYLSKNRGKLWTNAQGDSRVITEIFQLEIAKESFGQEKSLRRRKSTQSFLVGVSFGAGDIAGHAKEAAQAFGVPVIPFAGIAAPLDGDPSPRPFSLLTLHSPCAFYHFPRTDCITLYLLRSHHLTLGSFTAILSACKKARGALQGLRMAAPSASSHSPCRQDSHVIAMVTLSSAATEETSGWETTCRVLANLEQSGTGISSG